MSRLLKTQICFLDDDFVSHDRMYTNATVTNVYDLTAKDIELLNKYIRENSENFHLNVSMLFHYFIVVILMLLQALVNKSASTDRDPF